MSFPGVVLTVILVIGGLSFAHSGIPPAPDPPRCMSRGRPPQMLIFSSLPLRDENNTRNTIYQAHYCHPTVETNFCFRAPEGYSRICTFNNTNRIRSTLFQCNMTGLIWNLYPNLYDPRLPAKLKGNTLCMIVSATNENETSYSESKCCSVRATAQCKGISSIQLEAPAKRTIHIKWRTPSDISDNMAKVLEYAIWWKGNNESKMIRFNVFIRGSPPRQHSLVIKNLVPYTPYSIKISCYFKFVWPPKHFTRPKYVRTLSEAPNGPPKITGVQTVSLNDTMKTVKLYWQHPPKNKRNGIISKSVVKYWIQKNVSSSSLSAATNLTIHGSTTEAFLEGLQIKQDYMITVTSCTVACSNQSSEYQIKGTNGPLPTPQASTGSSFSSTTLAVSLVVSLGLVSMVIGLVIYLMVRQQKRKNKGKEPIFPPLDDIQVSSDDNDSGSVGLFENESSDYTRPNSPPISVECNHERASMLQNENDGNVSGEKMSNMEEIFL